ncbi:hypothetical protein DFJ58DRAFT_104742 [Suillus subalutaceus]|uniref:uncharacterized protein n=1 Tax=Suillus subalutaceus TaxID=48586 RepID=UPI001B865FC5|nr:uncharacterized protein DFJ58DRAFT_104742 [Suillus subalutaceus]KAG1839650.1 hypothetical protein DFJ58DRAFT_104742 [Suillus subalutaceus]
MEDEPLTLAEEILVDSFTPMPQRIVKPKSGSLNAHQDATLQNQRRISSQSTRLEIVPEASDEEESLDIGQAESNTQAYVRRFSQPSAAMDLGHTPANPLSLWDALDLEINSVSSHYSNSSTASREEPRENFGTLRKSRSVAFQDRAGSALSIASTVPSTKLHIRNKLRKRMRPASTPTLRSPHLDPLLKELPLGVKQIGYGIGFSPTEPLSSRSKSVYRSAIRACQKLVPVIRRKISRKVLSKRETPTPIDSSSSRDAMVVIRGLYGPTWTLGMESLPPSVATDTLSATTNDSEGPVTPETPFFAQTVGIVHHESSTLRLVPSSGLQPFI